MGTNLQMLQTLIDKDPLCINKINQVGKFTVMFEVIILVLFHCLTACSLNRWKCMTLFCFLKYSILLSFSLTRPYVQ